MRVETHRKRENPLLLNDWSELLDNYINLNDFEILNNKEKLVKKTPIKQRKKNIINTEQYKMKYTSQTMIKEQKKLKKL